MTLKPKTPWPNSVSRFVICIGAQKAATSFLHEELSKNSRVCVPMTKEVHYWDAFEGSFAGMTLKRTKLQLRRALSTKSNKRKQTRRGIARRFADELALAKIRIFGAAPHHSYRDYLLRLRTH